ncbi:MAG TPA: hypothetical protein PK393_02930 [Synergistaceae bacterium]|nr:hypothetical protein [Synergistaceae bacterium]HQK24459.1 hypothetical protein [Synergistaceae bacterium]
MGVQVTWFIPRDVLPWEVYVLRSLAGGLKGHDVTLRVLSQHPGSWGTMPVLYWDAARVGERWRHLLRPGALWHFWGGAPSWHALVAFRAKTIHTQWRTTGPWRGLASSFSSQNAREGEVRLWPAFDKQLLWNNGGDAPSVRCGEGGLSVLVPPRRRWVKGVRDALRLRGDAVQWIPWGPRPEDFGEELPLSEALYAHWRERGGVLVFPALPEISDGWLAAHGALMAVPVVAAPSPVLDDLLGHGGYIPVDLSRGATVEAWIGALDRVMSSEGRAAAARARQHLELSFSPSSSGEELAALYRRVCGAEVQR